MTSTASTRIELDLSGTWQLAFDRDQVCDRQGWARGHWTEAHSESIQVPAIWNITFPDGRHLNRL